MIRLRSASAAIVFSAFTALLVLVSPGRARASTAAEVVTSWNQVTLEAGRHQNFLLQSRALAMVHAAMFDAANGVDRRYASYFVDRRAQGVSGEAAVAAAAQTVLSGLYPRGSARWQAALQVSVAHLAMGPRTRGIEFGKAIGLAVLSKRRADGATAELKHPAQARPGGWRPTPPDHAAALSPHWRNVSPFLIRDVKALLPPPPPRLDSELYAQEFDEVKRIGEKSSTHRSPDQTAASVFWTGFAMDFWSSAARQAVAQRQNLKLVERARIFALMSGAIADAFIVGWASKYHYALWRPVTAIPAAATDGNARTQPDAAWEPLITTPPFPCYVSAHTITSGAAEQALRLSLGTDQVAFTITNPSVGLTRHYGSFSALAREALDVRIWSGVHFRSSQAQGLQAGRRIGAVIFGKSLRPLTAKTR